ncbi:acyltransferase domain-containing protein [Alcaligenes faecalis]|uniref:acyltransferase domain-containing protein n=1 Tax=Alcaligenes faecalis TaxID=511 RepID=UPI001C9AB4DE|nr:acyltransferase domain-containing protein [Alcaligenes faecalis]MBY6309428.1 acyltransferase domain-containing protein [Alcaligenes faecalis]MBY6317287.1 acyltransferase domain-containing protein [Alcaligenes faecalis]MBY6391369.1 acyltransferase domain-containing protein [Alcaligenes faecalis]
MKIALLFSGQGMQYADMLPWMNPAHPLLLQMQDQLHVPDWRAAMRDSSWASTNAHAQVVLTACALAAWQQLQEQAPALQSSSQSLAAVAGYSIGELAAACVAGVLSASDTVKLAGQRAALMDQAGAGQDSSMLAVSGVSIRTIEQWCQAQGAALAIRNGPDSAVCAGPRDKLAALEKFAQEQGARCTPLAVNIASHTHWMSSAAQAFQEQLNQSELAVPNVPWPTNAGVWVHNAATAAQALSAQIMHTMQWDSCMEQIEERQPNVVLEIGPGRSLATMWNQRYSEIPARSVDEFQTLDGLQRWLSRWAG